jgi:hypothetical protein
VAFLSSPWLGIDFSLRKQRTRDPGCDASLSICPIGIANLDRVRDPLHLPL